MPKEDLGFKWAVFLGGFGFAAGFFGPMIFAPGANQGPMLGIFITGPLGFLTGLVLWKTSNILKWTPSVQWKVFYATAAALLLAVLSVAIMPRF
jgi:hypothetical protein